MPASSRWRMSYTDGADRSDRPAELLCIPNSDRRPSRLSLQCSKLLGSVYVVDGRQLYGGSPIRLGVQQVAQSAVSDCLLHDPELAAFDENRRCCVSLASARDDWPFTAASEDRRDAARRQRWLITKQDHGGFDGRGKRGNPKLQRLAHPPLRMGVAHPQNRLLRGRPGREPRWHDRDDRIEASTHGTCENVLQ